MPEPLGFIGLGLMGRPMAGNLLKAGYPVVVTSRSQGPVDALVAAGATHAATPAEVARQTTRIFMCLPDSPDVEHVMAGDGGVFGAMQPGTIIVDHSTISPTVARQLAARAAELGGAMLDAPISGGDVGAKAGTLSIMVGGDQAAFDAVKPILDVMGNPEKVIRIGEAGAGQLCKVCNQMVIGGTLTAVSEAFALARKAGVDPARVREALLGGYAQSKVLEVHAERILSGKHVPGFRAKLYAKDIGIASDALASHQVPAPVTAVVRQLVSALLAAGRGEDDLSGLATVLFDMAQLDEAQA
jgi:2-hydroxy-3-oxopropionate reductase